MRSWLNYSLLKHPLSVPVLLVSVILTVYYPALLSGIHPVDDPGIFSKYSASPSLSTVLSPGTGFYYRPLLEFSYYLDNRLWGMEPGIMHLENILLHCFNSLLVFLLARKTVVRHEHETLLIPLLAALLFALHPVNVESITWIAGRSDPLLALFVLSASYCLLKWLENPRWLDIATAQLFFLAALLTKETALAFGAFVPLFALAWPGAATIRQRLKLVVIMLVPGLVLVLLALVFRSGASGLSRFLSSTDLRAASGVQEALIALGFYAKKFIIPFPLNSAISSVPPLYGILGFALLPILWLVLRHDRKPGLLFIAAVLFILPAILVAVNRIAWTPYAERYLYLPTAFLTLGLAGSAETWNRRYSIALLTFFVLLLCGAGLGSFQRNLLWKSPLSFFQDAVAKSPEFGSVYYSLGGELMQKGEIDRASATFATAEKLNRRDSMRYPIKAGIMGTMLAKGEYLQARTYFFQTFTKKQDAPADFLELLYKADGKRIEIIGNRERHLLAHDLLETLDLLNQKKPDPYWLYRSGQISLIIGDDVRSADFFRRSYAAAPVDAHYKAAAKTYLMRLEAGH